MTKKAKKQNKSETFNAEYRDRYSADKNVRTPSGS